MSPLTVFLICCAVLFVLHGTGEIWSSTALEALRCLACFAVWLVLLGSIIVGCEPYHRESQARYAAQEQADAQPRLVREFDGCKVYTFKDAGHWRYVTKCDKAQATTESPVIYGSGKNKRTELESITTQ